MKFQTFSYLFFLLVSSSILAQSNGYQQKKEDAIAKGSPFTKIINRELPADIVFENDDIIAFVPLKKQARVHLLIVPKKEIQTMNDTNQDDAMLLGKMLLTATQLAKDNGISTTGYRISINTNEDSGQSVFHIHMHLLGGNTLGPMVDRID